MAPWSSKIIKRFSTIPPNAHENDFYAPYNKLLYTIFPADSDYTVAPQTYSIMDSRQAVDSIVKFEVHLEDKPVFFLVIKAPKRMYVSSARKEADDQMRTRMQDLAPFCPLDTLNGVSAFGTRLSFYSFDKQTQILPQPIPPHPYLVTDTAPLDRWDCDILEDEGAQRFQNLVAEIKEKCNQLPAIDLSLFL
jgi:hypothetical protein